MSQEEVLSAVSLLGKERGKGHEAQYTGLMETVGVFCKAVKKEDSRAPSEVEIAE